MAYSRHLLSVLRLGLLCLLSLVTTFSYAADQAVNTQLNINEASADQIRLQLPGIGIVKAQAIVEYRDRNGPFAQADQLLNIKGVGPHTLARIRPLLQFGKDQGLTEFYLRAGQQNKSARDKAIRQKIKRIVTRAKQAATE